MPGITNYLSDLYRQRSLGKIGSFDASNMMGMVSPGFLPTDKFSDAPTYEMLPDKK